MLRIPFTDLFAELDRVLRTYGFRPDRADRCARLFAETTLDGVYSHGLNRFPRFIEMIRRGVVDVHAEPECIGRFGALERWEGHMGPGNLNAYACMERALSLAREHGMGGVAVRNTNHWMRGGTYGWQAAEAGLVGICWTNTNQNLPAWGARDARLGNNPLVLAVPRAKGHVVLDMAMSQFSYGALASYRGRGELLPVDGGFDREGRLTRDPGAIEAAGRPLPIGFWKGSGLSLMLDLLATLLSDGRSTHQISHDPLEECGLSQVFLAVDLSRLQEEPDALSDRIIAHLHGSSPSTPGGRIRYPGERTLETRKENLERGVPVEPAVWHEVQAMGKA